MSLPTFPWRSLKTKLILFTLLVFLVSVWTVVIVGSELLGAALQRQLGQQQFATVSLLAAQINEQLEVRLNALETVAKGISPAALKDGAALQTLLQERPIIGLLFNGGVIALGANGTALADVPRTSGRAGVNYMDRPNIAAALAEGKSAIGRPVLGKKLVHPVISMAVPIHDARGDVIGALVGVIDLGKPNFLEAIVESRHGGHNSYVINDPPHGLTVTATDRSLRMRPNPAPGLNPLFDRYVQGFEGSGSTTDSRGIRVVSAAKRIPAAGWLLIGRTTADEALIPIAVMKERALLLATFFTLLAGCLIWWLTSRMLRIQFSPMIDATRTLTELSPVHSAPQPLPITSRDEIGDLIGSFNTLLGELGRREEALTKSEARFSTLVEWSPDPLAVHRDGKLIYANPAAVAMFGAQSSQELINKPILDFVHPDFHDFAMSRVRAATEQHMGSPLKEEKFVKLDGTPIDVEVQSTPIDYDGRPAVQVVMHDISKRIQAEKALREQEIKYHLLFETANDGILLLGEAGYIDCNQRGAEMYGCTKDALIGRSPADYSPERQADGRLSSEVAAERIQSALQGKPQLFEWQSLRVDGVAFDVEVTLSPIQIGTSMYLQAIVRDITERKRAELARASLEAQLREAQKMEAVGILAGGIAHDFNNILGVILGNASLAKRDVQVRPEEALASVDEIDKAAKRARNLVRQILTFSRRNVQAFSIQPLRPMVEESVKLLRATIPAGVSITTHYQETLRNLRCDATHIEQVVINLCTNAWQAVNGNSGRIEIALRDVPLDEVAAKALPGLHPGNYVCMSVNDDGVGMDETTKAHIFEPFFTTKEVGKGTGLGLSVVHGIVKAHHGAITVKSAPGQGTTFEVFLPVEESSQS